LSHRPRLARTSRRGSGWSRTAFGSRDRGTGLPSPDSARTGRGRRASTPQEGENVALGRHGWIAARIARRGRRNSRNDPKGRRVRSSVGLATGVALECGVTGLRRGRGRWVVVARSRELPPDLSFQRPSCTAWVGPPEPGQREATRRGGDGPAAASTAPTTGSDPLTIFRPVSSWSPSAVKTVPVPIARAEDTPRTHPLALLFVRTILRSGLRLRAEGAARRGVIPVENRDLRRTVVTARHRSHQSEGSQTRLHQRPLADPSSSLDSISLSVIGIWSRTARGACSLERVPATCGLATIL
jgi:hypothetical protein